MKTVVNRKVTNTNRNQIANRYQILTIARKLTYSFNKLAIITVQSFKVAASKILVNQIKKRGLNPADFGVISQKVSDDFSWKGYTRMICTRLEATMDPSLPETCGCPPMNWPGWRIAS